ncbi:MAG: prepilin-type N-terminal cleavage/methylation domain-containing protein [Lachnospiraceae bacterium]
MQKRQEKKTKKLNNSGMSLIEVLVAVLILAVVTGPILSSFVSAIRYNAKAKEKQRVTTAAQSIMEGFKAYDIEELCWQFNGEHPFRVVADTFSFSETAISDHVLDGVIAADGINDTSIMTAPDGTRIFVPASDNRYEFVLQNITFEGTTYDAKVTAVPHTAADGLAGVQSITDMETMNGYLDAVYKQSSGQDSVMYAEVLSKVLDKLNEKDAVYEYELENLDKDKINVTKETYINITSVGGVDKVTVEYKYYYTVTDYPYFNEEGVESTFSLPEDGVTTDFVSPSSVTVYDNTNTVSNGAKLETVYCYYYPSYGNVGGTRIASDTIYINNSTGVAKDVYLVKQVNTSLSNGQLLTCESSYMPDIIGSGSINLYHNLYENLASPGSAVGTVDLSGVNPIGELVSNGPAVLLYDIQVSVYEQGAAAAGFTTAPLLVLDGSMNNK